MASWAAIARRIRVPLGFAFAVLYFWLAKPTVGSILIGAGLVAGVILTFALSHLVRSFLYQFSPLDAWTYCGVLLTLSLIGVIAALVPAHRAASIQPVQALREE